MARLEWTPDELAALAWEYQVETHYEGSRPYYAVWNDKGYEVLVTPVLDEAQQAAVAHFLLWQEHEPSVSVRNVLSGGGFEINRRRH